MTVLLDLLAIAIFGLLARAAHQSPDMPFTFAGWVDTTWPFLLGVLIGALVLRAAKITRGSAVVMWLSTVIVGLAIWALRHQQIPHWSFIVVASTTSAVLMFGWRAIGSMLNKRRAAAA